MKTHRHLEEESIRVFRSRWIRERSDIPAFSARVIDVALLDMHHGWPNMGHDSFVRAVGEIARDLAPLLAAAGMTIRVLSYDVRGRLMIPEGPGGRHAIYLGTGGPGHIDPRCNDGISEGTQGITDDPAWEAPLHGLFDAIYGNSESVLLAVCHTFGVLCRWSGVAEPVLRGADKRGKSSGIVENILTEEAVRHPWFSRMSARLPDGRRFKVLDSRLFDLVPRPRHLPNGMLPVSFECRIPQGAGGEALTMLEIARDREGVMPRMFAVNHHPEIRDRRRQLRLLKAKLARGEVTRDWYEERTCALDQVMANREIELSVKLTSQYTLIALLRFHLYRQVRLRAAALGFSVNLHEDLILRLPSGTIDREESGEF